MGGPTGLEGGHISKSYYYLILGGLVYEKTYFCGKKSNNFIIPFYFTIKQKGKHKRDISVTLLTYPFPVAKQINNQMFLKLGSNQDIKISRPPYRTLLYTCNWKKTFAPKSVPPNVFLNGPIPTSFVYFRSFHTPRTNIVQFSTKKTEKQQMLCLGCEPTAAGWQAQTDPLCYDGRCPTKSSIHAQAKKAFLSKRGNGFDQSKGVVVNWSACSPSTPTIRVQIPLKSTVLFCKLCGRAKIIEKEVGDGPFNNIKSVV